MDEMIAEIVGLWAALYSPDGDPVTPSFSLASTPEGVSAAVRVWSGRGDYRDRSVSAKPTASAAVAALRDMMRREATTAVERTTPPGATDAEVARLRAELADARRELADVRANYEELCHAVQTHRTASLALEEARILRLGENAGAVDLRTATHLRDDALAKLYALAGVEL